MQERTIIISSRELVDYTVLSRKKNELLFKKDLLMRSGAKEGDLHLKTIQEELKSVEEKLAPIAEKLEIADMVTLVPNRKEIEEYTRQINSHSRAELEQAVRTKSGSLYELMKKRAEIVKRNYEKREEIARLTIFLNTIPRKEAEALRQIIEENEGPDVDVSFLPKEKQQELVNLAARLGRNCMIVSGSFSLDKKKADFAELRPTDEVQRNIGGKIVWVEASKAGEFDANEKLIGELLAKIQAKAAEKQARELSEEESVYFEKIQKDYLEALKKRSQLVPDFDAEKTAKVYTKQKPQ
ncbi:MAG: hypothetical protein N3G80_00555 [Candidatus Micrarchaeota archaeon]|nr:hypothetical protein [Candidatus Micrarchaeota archaeon]